MRIWAFWVTLLCCPPPSYASVPKPADWVPARWPWSDAKSLELLAGSPVNCLLLNTWPAPLVDAAAERGIVTLAVIPPAPDPVAAAKAALAAKVTGILLEGDFPAGAVASVRAAAGD